MRVLLREPGTGRFLQPSGEWDLSRNTARAFDSSVAAYFRALEQKLLGVEVLLAFSDCACDSVVMRVHGGVE